MSEKFKEHLNEASEEKRKMKPRLHKLDDQIEKFIEEVEKQVDAISDNPVFQRKVNQMIVDMSKEHSEFIMALRAVVAALDRGSQVVPKTKPKSVVRGIKDDESEMEEEPTEDDI